MKYPITRNPKYDFAGQSYADTYPNLHKYPATMIPQVGIELFKELGINRGRLLDPYCGSGSSFIVGLDRRLSEMDGCDINPLAVLIARAKFTKIDIESLENMKQRLRSDVYEFSKNEENFTSLKTPDYTNIHFWFSKEVLLKLTILRNFIDLVKDDDIKRFFWVPLSETIRECSWTRSNEYKLFRMKPEELLNFNPDVFDVYFYKLNKCLDIYKYAYLPLLIENQAKINVEDRAFEIKDENYDIVLTSPPYGDSATTVAYGQFSMFANEWMGMKNARRLDRMMMGGQTISNKYLSGLIAEPIMRIHSESPKRALEVSSFYFDLENSIRDVAASVRRGGIAIYIVGNRRVKDVQLPTDQFIAEKFEQNGFKHLFTYERLLGNKVIPSRNSPTNKAGQASSTMTREYIVASQKIM